VKGLTRHPGTGAARECAVSGETLLKPEQPSCKGSVIWSQSVSFQVERIHVSFRCFDKLAIASLLICSACGGGGSTGSSGPPPPTITSVSVSPTSANVEPGAGQQFTAKVSGTGNFPSTVRWSVGGPSDDANLGTISSAGFYTAANNPPNPNTVSITATSTLDVSKSGSGSIVVGSSPFQITGVTISPTSANLKTTQTQQFTAAVQGTGSFSNAVRWSMGDDSSGNSVEGTISASGLYTAPELIPSSGSVTVEVTSAVDSAIKASAQVTLTQNPPTITQLSPSTANASDSVEVTGTGYAGTFAGADGIVTVFFPGPGGIQLAVLPDSSKSSVTQLFVVVPLSAVSGQAFVQVQAHGSIQQSNSVVFTRLPRVRIRAAQRDLSAGESVSFQSRILGSGTTDMLTWSADVGSVSSDGMYTAPASVKSDSFAVVTACVQGTQICDQERLGLHPFRVAPTVPVDGLGQSVQLSGIQGSATVDPTWQLKGPGSLTSSGDYTASSELTGGGGVLVTATYSGVTEQTSLSVTGAVPGIVNRVADYINLTQTPFPLGTRTAYVGIAGNNAYVESADYWNGVTSPNYYWVDVYDVSNPTNPVWTDAFEPAALGQLLSCNGYLYQFAGQDYSQVPTLPGVIAVYDISGPHPALLSRQISPVATPVISSQTGCVFTEISLAAYEASATGAPVVLDQFNLQQGNVVHAQYSLALPSSITAPTVGGFASDGNLMFLLVNNDLITYDLSTQPPTQVGLIQVGFGSPSSPSIVGNLLFVSDINLEIPASQIFDVSTPQPVLLTTLPVGPVLASTRTTVVSGTGQTGLTMVDISDPQQPRLTGTVFDYVNTQYTVALMGNYVLSTEAEGGLAIYDLTEPGGLLPSYLAAPSVDVPGPPAFAQTSNASNLYFAIANAVFGGGVLDYDLRTQPPTPVGGFSTSSSLCQALALSNSYLYVGATDSLRVLDVSNPASLTQVDSISGGISALAVTGNSLFAGTVDNRLVVYDISQPANPSQRTNLNLPGLPIEFVISGNLLLVADSSAGLLIYNITTPSAPVLLSQTTPSTSVTDIVVDGNLALLAAWDGGLVIVDITNPAAPQLVGQAKLDTIDPYAGFQSYLLNKAATVAVLNRVAFVGVYNADTNDPPENGNGMIYGFDYTQPANPRLVYLGANGVVADAILTIRSVGSHLFAGGTSTLIEFDPSQPRDVVNLFFPPAALRPPPNQNAAHLLRTARKIPSWREPETGKRLFQLPQWRKYR